jgi:hypothetical protein
MKLSEVFASESLFYWRKNDNSILI